MKTILCLALIMGTIVFSATATFAQCDRNNLSPIKCGFYDEGYQDGSNDARNNQNSDYRRYREKLTSQYESFYRQGYNAGYSSAGGGGGYNRWSSSQRTAYDVGYNAGQNDRSRSMTRDASRGSYSGDLYIYFQQGYNDGYDGRNRQYDVPIGGNYPGYPGNPGYPGPGAGSGMINWSGRVDDRLNLVIQGGQVRTEVISGTDYGQGDQNSNAVLPRRSVTVTARKLDGRGSVSVIQQPRRSNNFTAIVQISDSKGGAGDYRVEISW
jgi:hypothetical protein